MEKQIPEKDWVKHAFTDFEKSLNGGASLPIHQKRKEAFSKYAETGFPTVKDEEWRYTNPLPILEGGFQIVNAGAPSKESIEKAASFAVKDLSSARIVVVDGVPVIEQSALKGVTIRSIKECRESCDLGALVSVDEQFVAINTSFLQDGIVIEVEPRAQVQTPIEIIWTAGERSQNALVCPRVLVHIGAGASCSLVERFEAAGATRYFTNSVVEFHAGENASVDHYRIQNESLEAFHVSTIAAKTGANARVRTHTFSFGGKLVRNNVSIVMDGSGCDVTMNGLSALSGSQHVDNHTVLDHAKPHCESHELYKGIYGGTSQGVFSGTIIVRPDAQKTNAIQSNRSLLLTPTAQVNTKPQLKIWADDVKCTHGATIGQLDEEALFYIRSRGAKLDEARNMLVHAFASEVISEVKLEPMRELLEAILVAKLEDQQK